MVSLNTSRIQGGYFFGENPTDDDQFLLSAPEDGLVVRTAVQFRGAVHNVWSTSLQLAALVSGQALYEATTQRVEGLKNERRRRGGEGK